MNSPACKSTDQTSHHILLVWISSCDSVSHCSLHRSRRASQLAQARVTPVGWFPHPRFQISLNNTYVTAILVPADPATSGGNVTVYLATIPGQ